MKDEELLTKQRFDRDHRYKCPVHGPVRNDHILIDYWGENPKRQRVCRRCSTVLKLRI